MGAPESTRAIKALTATRPFLPCRPIPLRALQGLLAAPAETKRAIV